MEKIYYDKKTGFLCGRFPKDLPIDESCFIEVDKEDAEKTYSCQAGTFWGVKDGILQLLPNEDEEYLEMRRRNEMAELEGYLSETDYVISKLNELKLEDDESYESERERYSEVLLKRKEARARLNELK